MNGPNIKGNPLKISVFLLVISYVIGEFFIPKYPLLYFLNLIGILGLLTSISFFVSGFNLFKSYEEDPTPTSSTSQRLAYRAPGRGYRCRAESERCTFADRRRRYPGC